MYIKESSFVQEWYNEGLQKGIEKGREEGRQEGRQEGFERGKIEALRGSILDVLQERFGQVEPDIIQAVNQIQSTSTLKSIHKMSIKVASLQEMRRILSGTNV